MAGNRESGLKARETNYARYGRDIYRIRGRLGGLRCVPKGFSMMTPERRSELGFKGGTISKRRPQL